MMFRKKETLTCSFCGKSETEVAKLVAGPRVYICDQCVRTARQVMEQDGDEPPDFQRGARRANGS
jgi:ATP-dependent Clp protease ATP-binding subunit ClpX